MIYQEIQHQVQPTWNSCVSTCLAMILDSPAQDIIDEFHDDYHGDKNTIIDYLTSKGLKIKEIPRGQNIDLTKEGLYLINVPSINIRGRTHQLVANIYKEDNGFRWQLLDPAMGREGSEYYVWDAGEEVIGESFAILSWEPEFEILGKEEL